jgi:hypothetical protein
VDTCSKRLVPSSSIATQPLETRDSLGITDIKEHTLGSPDAAIAVILNRGPDPKTHHWASGPSSPTVLQPHLGLGSCLSVQGNDLFVNQDGEVGNTVHLFLQIGIAATEPARSAA